MIDSIVSILSKINLVEQNLMTLLEQLLLALIGWYCHLTLTGWSSMKILDDHNDQESQRYV